MSQKRIDQKTAFLEAFRVTASLTEAAKAVGLNRSAHYSWLAKDAKYPARFEAAKIDAAAGLEDEAIRRAREGVLEPIFYQGVACGAKRVYSDGLLQFLLRGFMPAKYKQNGSLELTGANGGPIDSRHEIVFVRPGEVPTDLK